jgi:hypothetical protein
MCVFLYGPPLLDSGKAGDGPCGPHPSVPSSSLPYRAFACYIICNISLDRGCNMCNNGVECYNVCNNVTGMLQ